VTTTNLIPHSPVVDLSTRIATNPAKPTLTLESTLQELALHDRSVAFDNLGKDLSDIFDQHPLLPGIIIVDQGTLAGMISRRRFLEQLSRPYGLDLFMNRPISILYPFVKTDFAIFEGDQTIVAATHQALQRSPEQLYEPLVIKLAERDYRLLDFHNLLMAHSQIHQLAQQVIQEKTEAQVIQTEKMASLGRIVASVAHEINNPVNFIAGNLNYLATYAQDLINLVDAYEDTYPEPPESLLSLKDDIGMDFLREDLPRLLDSVKMGSERLKTIVLGLRNFSHMNESERKSVDLHQSIENTLVILNSRLKSRIDVIKDYGHLPPVSCYSGQLSQVFMNIISNAIDALMEEAEKRQSTPQQHTQGTTWQPQITITTALLVGNENGQNGSHTNVADAQGGDRWVAVRIADNGPGIPQEAQDKIFETFYTTKPAGEGTGLGLAISRQIVVDRHGGKLNLKSTLGQGTEFEILLPVGQE
jgi:signal transduction histidine kinase